MPGKLPLLVAIIFTLATDSLAQSDEAYLSWSEKYAIEVGKGSRASGKVAGPGPQGVFNTNRALRYKLRVTWLTPELIRAAARLEQIRGRLSDEQTRRLVGEAERAADTVFLVEIDPVEGSGVIPVDWRTFLQPKGLARGQEGAVRGADNPMLRSHKALAGVEKRDYNYDRFWVAFPLFDNDGKPVFPPSTPEVELIVQIYNKEGKVTFTVPESIRQRMARN